MSNACKYNTRNGKITIITRANKVIISNDSHGVKNPSKVFERFYKEGERGLGIGLHIVDKLSNQLGIDKLFSIKENVVTVELSLGIIMLKKALYITTVLTVLTGTLHAKGMNQNQENAQNQKK